MSGVMEGSRVSAVCIVSVMLKAFFLQQYPELMCEDRIGVHVLLFLVGNPKDQLVPVSVAKVRCN